MKRAGNLYSRITGHDNIHIAYYKASKGKRCNKDVLLIRQNEEEDLLRLEMDLRDETVELGNYHFFKIYDPKERTICAADFRERILHHAVMNVLYPVFERFLIHDTYACRKGTHKAVKRAFYFTKKYSCFVKMDMRKYFDSINHTLLKEMLRRKFKDKAVLALLDRIIDSYNTAPGRGTPHRQSDQPVFCQLLPGLYQL